MILGSWPALLSPMIFDAPGSEKKSANYVLAWSLMSFPLVCLLSIVLSQWALWVNAPLWAYLSAMLPLVNIAIGSAGWAWISWKQGGSFNG
jgi:hypothetical protein